MRVLGEVLYASREIGPILRQRRFCIVAGSGCRGLGYGVPDKGMVMTSTWPSKARTGGQQWCK
jgi:hypothetical protein